MLRGEVTDALDDEVTMSVEVTEGDSPTMSLFIHNDCYIELDLHGATLLAGWLTLYIEREIEKEDEREQVVKGEG